MKTEIYVSLISRIEATLRGRLSRKQYLVGPLQSGGPLQEARHASANAHALPEGCEADLEILAKAPIWAQYGLPVIIDAAKAMQIIAQSQDRSPGALESVFMQARFTFMGTDGMRGKVAQEAQVSPCAAYLGQNLLSAELVGLASKAFALMALENDQTILGDRVILGNDGRDRVRSWALNSAMNSGFTAAGLVPEDLGTMPTPYIPWKMLRDARPCGAVLTASHNPANQNGIKFFLKGKKLLPEGPCGDYALSAGMLALALEHADASTKALFNNPFPGHIPDGSLKLDERELAADLTVAKLPLDLGSVLRKRTLVLDSANGAFFGLAPAILDRLGLDWSTVNTHADGANINHACGVAEIEGHDRFGKEESSTALALVQGLFKAGREGRRRVYGLALDGDGDRGFVLVYDPAEDEVLVLNGDLCGYILARHFQKHGGTPGGHFVLTVESDLMTAYHARNELGLTVGIVSVGDKWIGNYRPGPVLVGLEASGHLIFPLEGHDSRGRPYQLLAGNGLLATLMVVYALEKDAWPMDQIREPFVPGFARTWYTFFVDKSRFYRGSTVWNRDMEIIRDYVDEAHQKASLPAGIELRFEDKEETNMLYGGLYEGGKHLGAVFVRNSGTEDKTAAYVQCRQELAPVLQGLGTALSLAHRETLKNTSSLEYRLECALLAHLANTGEVSFGALQDAVGNGLGRTLARADFYGLVHGLKKEGRITLDQESRVSLVH